MKIAVFSDIHGNYQALVAIINDIKRNNYDDVLFLGDCISLGPNSKDCLDLIIKNNIKYVLGNHELYYLRGHSIDRDMDYNEVKHHLWIDKCLGDKYKETFFSMPFELNFNFLGHSISFIHFFHNDEKYPFYHLNIFSNNEYKDILDKVNSEYVFFGHDHNESFREINNKKYYGVGSSGCTKNDITYYYSLDVSKDNVAVNKKELHYNRKKFENIIKNTIFPNKKDIINIFFGIK